jgi:hypothetical protein
MRPSWGGESFVVITGNVGPALVLISVRQYLAFESNPQYTATSHEVLVGRSAQIEIKIRDGPYLHE